MKPLLFRNRLDFHLWLKEHANTSPGVYLTFSKSKELKTLTAHDALLEALCFGWIDGVIKKVDDTCYIKYFAKRVKRSTWSKKNRDLADQLIAQNEMQEAGYQAILYAKKHGLWTKQDFDPNPTFDGSFEKLLSEDKEAKTFYDSLGKSDQNRYLQHYYSAKKEDTKKRRGLEIMKRLTQNKKPMDP